MKYINGPISRIADLRRIMTLVGLATVLVSPHVYAQTCSLDASALNSSQHAAAIQNSLDSCSELILSGDFNDNGGTTNQTAIYVRITQDDFVLRGGESSAATVLHGEDLTWDSGKASLTSIRIHVDASDVTIENITFRDYLMHGSPVIRIGNTWDGGSQNPNGNVAVENTRIVGNQFENMFTAGSAQSAVISVEAGEHQLDNSGVHLNHGNTLIERNFIRNWGRNGSGSIQAIKIGNQRLERNGQYFRRSELGRSLIRLNKIVTGNQGGAGNDSDSIQLYDPATVERNYISGSMNGISTKGRMNYIVENTITDIKLDGALYMRDGNRNVFVRNRIINNDSFGFYAWSGKQSIFSDNLFSGNASGGGQILASNHTGTRSELWNPVDSPDGCTQNSTSQTFCSFVTDQTSFQYANAKTVFANNTFADNGGGVYWNFNNVPTTRPDEIFFIKNRFTGQAGLSNAANSLFWDPFNGVPSQRLSNGAVVLIENEFEQNFTATTVGSQQFISETVNIHAQTGTVPALASWGTSEVPPHPRRPETISISNVPGSSLEDGSSGSVELFRKQDSGGTTFWVVYQEGGIEKFSYVDGDCRTVLISSPHNLIAADIEWNELDSGRINEFKNCSQIESMIGENEPDPSVTLHRKIDNVGTTFWVVYQEGGIEKFSHVDGDCRTVLISSPHNLIATDIEWNELDSGRINEFKSCSQIQTFL